MIACVGGGSNAIGIFTPFIDDAEVELIGVEAAGEGLDTRRHGASLGAGATGVLHGSLSSVIADEEGQILEAHSISAGLDYPGRRARARPAARQRPRHATSRSPTTQALAAFRELSRLEGIIPALESSHAIAWLLENARRTRGFDVLCLSGRGDKDLAEAIERRLETARGEIAAVTWRGADRGGLRRRPRAKGGRR